MVLPVTMNTKKTSHAPEGPLEAATVRKFSKARALAARYGICPKTLFRFSERGLIHKFKLNPRVVVFDEEQVAALFESARVSTSAHVKPASSAKHEGGL